MWHFLFLKMTTMIVKIIKTLADLFSANRLIVVLSNENNCSIKWSNGIPLKAAHYLGIIV